LQVRRESGYGGVLAGAQVDFREALKQIPGLPGEQVWVAGAEAEQDDSIGHNLTSITQIARRFEEIFAQFDSFAEFV
jgi:hypothetical protein